MQEARIHCSCGAVHADASELTKVGWQELGEGELALLVNCTCNSTIAAALITDAALCVVCRRVVVGDTTDPKIHAPHGTHCTGCANRTGITVRRLAA